MPREKKLRTLEFFARDDAAAARYCRGLMLSRLPKGARPLKLFALELEAPKRSSSRPRRSRSRKTAANPAPPTRLELKRAEAAFQRFTGTPATVIEQHFPPPMAGAAWALGPVPEIHYIATRDGRTFEYVHKFKKSARPLLAASSDGSMLYLLGGAYGVTDRGIEDDP